MKYTCNNIFMVRTPSLPAKVFLDLLHFDGKNIEDFIQKNALNDFMDKSILLSSRELYNAKNRNLQQSSKKEKSRNLSYLKYLTRAATRPTPYGLFAGVSLGEFSDQSYGKEMVINKNKAIVECRVDHAWLSHFIYELERNPVVYPQLQVKFNQNCYVSGDRLKNPYYANHGFSQEKKSVINRNHIRNTPLITLIKEKSRNFLSYAFLKTIIQDHYPEVPTEKIIETINILIDNEILLTNLRVPSNEADGLAHVLKVLKPLQGIDLKKESLQKLQTLLYQINKESQIEKIPLATVQEIYSLMEGLLCQTEEKDFLAVNKGIVLSENKLPKELKNTIERFIESVACLQVEGSSPLEKFKQKFQEEYGTDIEVPLCEVIDPNRFNGLAYLENGQVFRREEKDRKIKQIVDEKILYCLQTQEEEIILQRSDFASLESEEGDRFPESFDINFFVTKKKNGYCLTLSPIGGSRSAGDMFNRFSYVLDPELFKNYKKNNKKWVSPNPDVISVGIREENNKGRLGNVNGHTNENPYYVPIATIGDQSDSQMLTLDDLLIGMQNNQYIYIKSRSNKKLCKFKLNCMININLLSDVARLLQYVSYDNERSLISRIYNLFGNNYVFIPRIVFEGIITHPKRWNFPALLLKTDTFSAFITSFKKLCEKYHVDNVVYLVDEDNRLPLPLEKISSLEILYRHLRKYGFLQLDELEENLLTSGACIDNHGNNYVTEISCSLLRLTKEQNQIYLDDSLDYQLQENDRVLSLTQDGWIYVKLYQMDDRENEVLQCLGKALPNLGSPNIFYLRYSDEIGKHLRVRFQYKEASEAQDYLPTLQILLKNFQEYGLVNKIQFDSYYRENNRYGGSQLIKLAEQVFFADSRFVISLLNEFNTDEINDLEQVYLLGISHILTSFFDLQEDMLKQVALVPLREENKKAFRRKKQNYIHKVQQLISRDFSNLSNEVYLCIIERERAIKTYRYRISKVVQLTNSKESIISSVIHMFCNRLTGDRSLEQKYINIIREALFNIVEKERRLAKPGSDGM